MSILLTASEGLNKAEERVQRVAERLSRLPLSADLSAPADVVDLSAAAVALIEAKNLHGVNAKVIQTAAELDRHILNILG